MATIRWVAWSVTVGLSISISTSSAFAYEDGTHPGWNEAVADGKGDFAFLEKWFSLDGCAKGSFATCKDFKAALNPPKWPGKLIADALQPGSDELSSKACISSWGCETLAPSLELIALRGSPDDKPLLSKLLGNDKYWQEQNQTNRQFLVRILAWYGDKSFAPLIKRMVSFLPGREYTNVSLSHAAPLFERWNDNSLIDVCKEVFDPSLDGQALDIARSSCAHYLLRFGDNSVAGRLKRAKPGNDEYTIVVRAAMGDSSDKEEWQNTVKEFASSPGRPNHAAAQLALAFTGDAKAESAFFSMLTGKDPDAAFERARFLGIIQGTKLAKNAATACKKVVSKLGTKEVVGRTRAFMVGFLLRSGDASVLNDANAIFASDDSEVRLTLAKELSGTASSNHMTGSSSGCGGGAPIPGLSKVLDTAWGNESDNGVRSDIARCWAMLRSAGGN